MCRGRSGGSWSGKAEAWCSGETETPSLPHLTTHNNSNKKQDWANLIKENIPVSKMRKHKDDKVSCRLLVRNEEGGKGPLSPLVCICTEWHRLCTTPSLVWSGGVFLALFCDPPAPPSGWGRQSHSLCLYQSSLLCTKLEGHSSCSCQRPIRNPEPFFLPLPSDYPLPSPFQNPPWNIHQVHTEV